MGDALDGMTDAPVHTVNVSAFFMQTKEVTKEEWDSVREWGSTHGYADLAVGAHMGVGHPVQQISWYDMVKWCNERSEKEGLTPCYYTDAAKALIYRIGSTDIDNAMVKWSANGYRLPTEAEWEKAARGGLNGKRYPLGDSLTGADANFQYSAGGPSTVVGTYAPNGYGLYDMAGNVWERCWDWTDSGYYGVSPAVDPLGPSSGTSRMLRGGSWDSDLNGSCRVAYRPTGYVRPPGFIWNNYGFRTARR